MDDTYYTNKFYSEVCQLELNLFNDIEELFASLISFQFYIKPVDFENIREIHRHRQCELVKLKAAERSQLLLSISRLHEVTGHSRALLPTHSVTKSSYVTSALETALKLNVDDSKELKTRWLASAS